MAVLDLETVTEPIGMECLENGKAPVRVGPPYDDSSVVIAVIVADSIEDKVLLTNCNGPNETATWYVPCGDIECSEDLITAAQRHFRSETGMDLEDVRLVSIENYPSLRRNYIRFVVTGSVATDIVPDKDRWNWFPMGDLHDIDLLSCDITTTIRSANEERIAAVAFTPAVGLVSLPFLMVRVGLVADRHLLVIRDSLDAAWRLPCTYADYRSGESLTFASQRLCTRMLMTLPEIAGVVDIEHGVDDNRQGEGGSLGSRVTVLGRARDSMATIEVGLVRALSGSGLWRWIGEDDVIEMTRDDHTLAIIHRLIAVDDRTVPLVAV